MNKVYVSQQAPHLNLNPAMIYGDLIYMFGKGSVSQVPERKLLSVIQEKLVDFKQADYLILLGDPELMVLTFCVAYEKVEALKVLKYERTLETYILRTYENSKRINGRIKPDSSKLSGVTG